LVPNTFNPNMGFPNISYSMPAIDGGIVQRSPDLPATPVYGRLPSRDPGGGWGGTSVGRR
ncbi:MAG: hypothetical protein ACK55Z_08685, partial [bacterium]